MAMTRCPKCKDPIPFEDAFHEACGWNVAKTRQDHAQQPNVPCAHAGCPHPAIMRRRLPTGWAALCKHHDVFHVQLEADKFCADNGLETIAQKRAFYKEKIAHFGKADPVKHWQRVLDSPGLPETTYQMARAALKKLHARQPE